MKKNILPIILIVAILAGFGGYKIYWDKKASEFKAIAIETLKEVPQLTYGDVEAVGFPTDLRIAVKDIEVGFDGTPLLKTISQINSAHRPFDPKLAVLQRTTWKVSATFKHVEFTSNIKGTQVTLSLLDSVETRETTNDETKTYVTQFSSPVNFTVKFNALKELMNEVATLRTAMPEAGDFEDLVEKITERFIEKLDKNDFSLLMSGGKRATKEKGKDHNFGSLDAAKVEFYINKPTGAFKFASKITDLQYAPEFDEYMDAHPLLIAFNSMSPWMNQFAKLGKINMDINFHGAIPSQDSVDFNIQSLKVSNNQYDTDIKGHVRALGRPFQKDFSGDINLKGKTTYNESWYEATKDQFRQLSNNLKTVLEEQGLMQHQSPQYQQFIQQFTAELATAPENFIPRWHEHGTHEFAIVFTGGQGENGLPETHLTDFHIKDDKYGISVKQLDPKENLAETKKVDVTITNYADLVNDVVGYYRNIHPVLQAIDPKLNFELPATWEQKMVETIQMVSNTPENTSENATITLDGTNKTIGTLGTMELAGRVQQLFAEEIQSIMEQQRATMESMLQPVPAQ